MMSFDSRDERTVKLIGSASVNKLRNSKVAIFGVGGVGSYVSEALSRAGVGNITLIDGDEVTLSNVNRQLIALSSTMGENKAVAMAERIKDIDPEIKVEVIDKYYLPGDDFSFTKFDYVVDAIDDIKAKVDIIKSCYNNDVKVISAMGAGNKIYNDCFRVSYLSETHTDPLAKIMRKRLREEKIDRVKVVFSSEKPISVEGTPGTLSYVPGTEGLVIAGEVIREIIGINKKE